MSGDLEPAVSVAGARRALAETFREAGLDTPELDARLLVGHALGLDHAALTAQSARTIRGEEAERIRTFAARRIGREPVARIVGTKEFWSLPFVIAPAVLVPRPETETLVEAALGVVDAKRRQRLRIADLGTGSGALLLALLHELEGADGHEFYAGLDVREDDCFASKNRFSAFMPGRSELPDKLVHPTAIGPSAEWLVDAQGFWDASFKRHRPFPESPPTFVGSRRYRSTSRA